MATRVTLSEVAELAGVHRGTASRALNPQTESQLNIDTVRRVKQAAESLGYVPDALARGLRMSRSMTVGMIIPDLTSPIFPPIVRGIEEILQPQGYTALLTNSDGDLAVESSLYHSLRQRRVDGFLLATGRLDEQPVLARAQADGVLAVMVNREAGRAPFPAVIADSQAGIRMALDHALELGHRRIVHLSGPTSFSTTRQRREAFVAAARGVAGLEWGVHEAADLSIAEGERVMAEVLATSHRPTAVLAGNDLLALGALHTIRRAGLRCPEDLSVLGFNDMPFAGDLSPALTTIHVPLRQIGCESARMLLQDINSGVQKPITRTLPVSLQVRESTGPVPA